MIVKIKRFAPALVMTLAISVFCSAQLPANAQETGERRLIPSGRTVGIQMKTDGVLVIGLSVIETEEGAVSPASDAGIAPGDVIIKLGGQDTRSSTEFLEAASHLDGEKMSVTFIRQDKEMQSSITPVLNGDGKYQLGLWLRDGVSGIGTVTFVDPETGLYGALGHAISDIDTGIIMPLGSGSILESTVVDVRKGESGAPGELQGSFDQNSVKGSILKNTNSGIFGIMDSPDANAAETFPIAPESEIKLGAAKIISNVTGTSTDEYDIEIIRLYKGDSSERSMMLKITDPELLNITGGIVQGMSGSPVIQEGRIVGAITHVLINDPARGYGISIENMLSAALDDATDKAA